MLTKIKQSKSEKILLIFLILLAIFAFSSFLLIKNKCLFVENVKIDKLTFENRENIVVMNVNCGNVIIELLPEVSPNAVARFKNMIVNKEYDDVAFHRVVENFLVQAGDLEFGKKGNLNYAKIGTGKSGLGTINSEIDNPFNFDKGSVGLVRTKKYNTEDSQFFIILKDEPLYETEYTPVGKVIYGLKALEKIKYLDKSQYVLRPDFINSFYMLIDQ